MSQLCLARGRYIHTAEALAVTADAHQLCIEYSLLDDPPGGWPPSPETRARQSHVEIVDLVARVRADPRTIAFEVWLD